MGFKNKVKGGLIAAGAIAGAFAVASPASAHGWVNDQVGDVNSRSGYCSDGTLTDCGAIQYEPQSVEYAKGFPESGPADGQLCGVGAFPELDNPRGGDWPTNPVTSGGQVGIGWNYTANHATSKWEYYITKDGWSPLDPLSRDQLEAEPFATVDYDGSKPPKQHVDTIDLPQKSGQHVIYAVWEIADTTNSFYQCIDVDFSGDGGDPGGEDPGGEDPGGEEPGECQAAAWNADDAYLGGDQVSFNGDLYTAKWWTQGQEPGSTGEWGVWEHNGAC
ncbi:lytic polysaccharide monooxygenase [Salininema proteolyticum]|uniref:Lytic polysaccharide monooxygenase n=1 Tax=Salininema proteolyticum TaxID=1607685 RepID=A0ABV8U192_9ACTN